MRNKYKNDFFYTINSLSRLLALNLTQNSLKESSPSSLDILPLGQFSMVLNFSLAMTLCRAAFLLCSYGRKRNGKN